MLCFVQPKVEFIINHPFTQWQLSPSNSAIITQGASYQMANYYNICYKVCRDYMTASAIDNVPGRILVLDLLMSLSRRLLSYHNG